MNVEELVDFVKVVVMKMVVMKMVVVEMRERRVRGLLCSDTYTHHYQ